MQQYNSYIIFLAIFEYVRFWKRMQFIDVIGMTTFNQFNYDKEPELWWMVATKRRQSKLDN